VISNLSFRVLVAMSVATGTWAVSSSVAQPATASPGTCSHTSPAATAAQAAALHQPSGVPGANSVGDVTAKAVNDVVDSGDTFLVGGQAASGLPYGLDAGILGVVGSVTTGFKVVVDDSIIDPATLATRLRAAVPAAAAGTVGVESSCVSSAAMGSAWRALSARNWNDEASQVTFTMSLNAATEKIDVGLDSNAPAGSAAAMKALAPNLINITAGTGTG
jgi:streptogrisin D